jgi:integrase
LRRSEVAHLKVRDIDSQCMLLRVDQGKGGRDREVPLSPTLLAALREYSRWMRPETYLFPGTRDGWRADKPITTKPIWEAVRLAAQRAKIDKPVTPLRRCAFSQTFATAARLMGRSDRSPGNNQRGGRCTCHQARKISSSLGESIT